MSKSGIGFLDTEINRFLSAFPGEVADIIEDEAYKASKQCAKRLRAVSPRRNATEKSYAKGWTVKRLRRDMRSTVHNKNKPGLAHLLEYGHAGKSPAPAYEHIKPVADEETENFVDAVLERLSKSIG